MRHQQRDATVATRHARDTGRRTIRVERITFGRLQAMIDELQRHLPTIAQLMQLLATREFCATFAMRNDNRRLSRS